MLAITVTIQTLEPAGVYTVWENSNPSEKRHTNIWKDCDGNLFQLNWNKNFQISGTIQGFNSEEYPVFVSASISESTQYFTRIYSPNQTHI